MKSKTYERVVDLATLYDLELHTPEERVKTPSNTGTSDCSSTRYTEEELEIMDLLLHDEEIRGKIKDIFLHLE